MFGWFKKKERHEFDLENKLTGFGGLYEKIDGEFIKITYDGYQCKKCGKKLWVNYEDIIRIHKSKTNPMSFCKDE